MLQQVNNGFLQLKTSLCKIEKVNKKPKTVLTKGVRFRFGLVELRGIEPLSKEDLPLLSTYLSDIDCPVKLLIRKFFYGKPLNMIGFKGIDPKSSSH